MYAINRNKARKEVRNMPRQQTADNRNKFHHDIMPASTNNTKLFYKIINRAQINTLKSEQRRPS